MDSNSYITLFLVFMGAFSIICMASMLIHHEVKHYQGVFAFWTFACVVIAVTSAYSAISGQDTFHADLVLTFMFGVNSITSHIMRHNRKKREQADN